jgi:hypothetical protein
MQADFPENAGGTRRDRGRFEPATGFCDLPSAYRSSAGSRQPASGHLAVELDNLAFVAGQARSRSACRFSASSPVLFFTTEFQFDGFT